MSRTIHFKDTSFPGKCPIQWTLFTMAQLTAKMLTEFAVIKIESNNRIN